MPNVVRFALPAARTIYISGVGAFQAGILDIDANDLIAVARARFRVKPYGATEVGIVDSTTPKPSLPVPSGPPALNSDPYPQYLTPTEVATSPELRAASVAAVEAEATVAPTGAWDFTQTPTVAGVALGSGGGGGGSAPDATTTVKGIVELATSAEATTGTDTTRAVTPAALKVVADSKAAAGHEHPVTDLTATGTASASTFLRGDGSWAAPPSGGAVTSVNGQAGAVVLTPSSIGAVDRIVRPRRRLRFTILAADAVPMSLTDVGTRSNGGNGYYGGAVVNTTGRIASPLGTYYMLASPDHDPNQGGFYLFYANDLAGPWTVHNPSGATPAPPIFIEPDPAKGQLEQPTAIWDEETRQFLVFTNRSISGTALYTTTDFITYEDQGMVLSGNGSYPGYFNGTRMAARQWVGTCLGTTGNESQRIPVYSQDGFVWRSHPNSMQRQLDFHYQEGRALFGPSGQIFMVDGEPWATGTVVISGSAGGVFSDAILVAGPVRGDMRSFLFPPEEVLTVDTTGTVLHMGGGQMFVDNDASIYFVYRNSTGGFGIARGRVI